MNLYEHTGLGRPIDLRYRSNRLALAGASIGTLVPMAAGWLGTGDLDPFAAGVVGVAVFLAWAIARELDPDRPGTATAAMVVAGALAFLGTPAAGVSAAVLVGLRMISGTTGAPLRTADLVVVTGAAAYAGTAPEGWAAVIVLVGGIHIARRERSGVTIAVVIGAAVIAGAVAGARPDLGSVDAAALLVVGLSLVATVAATPVTKVSAVTDVGRRPLVASRLTKARLVAGGFVLLGLASGGAAAVSLWPVSGALVAVGAARLRVRRFGVSVEPAAQESIPR